MKHRERNIFVILFVYLTGSTPFYWAEDSERLLYGGRIMIFILRALGNVLYVITPFTFVWSFSNLICEMVREELDSKHKENVKGKAIYGIIAGFSLLLSFVANYELIF